MSRASSEVAFFSRQNRLVQLWAPNLSSSPLAHERINLFCIQSAFSPYFEIRLVIFMGNEPAIARSRRDIALIIILSPTCLRLWCIHPSILWREECCYVSSLFLIDDGRPFGHANKSSEVHYYAACTKTLKAHSDIWP